MFARYLQNSFAVCAPNSFSTIALSAQTAQPSDRKVQTDPAAAWVQKWAISCPRAALGIGLPMETNPGAIADTTAWFEAKRQPGLSFQLCAWTTAKYPPRSAPKRLESSP